MAFPSSRLGATGIISTDEMAEATRNGSAAVKAARKKKIRQLEASLFGGGGSDGVTTGLPELQRVDEYNSQFNTADRRNKPAAAAAGSGLPALKRAPVDRRKKFFASAKNKLGLGAGPRPTSRSDEEELLESSEESATTPESSGPMPPPPSTAQGDAARRGSLGANFLRSEVEQLDDSIKHLVKDPKREVLENLKRRHGVTKSPSMHDGIYTFPKQGSLTNVAAAAQAPLDRATLLERRRSLAQPPESAGRRRATSLDRTSRLLEQEQADLERTMSKPERTTTFSPQVDQGQREFSWPSMPEIKAPALALGSRKDSLQPIGRSRSPRQAAASPVSPTSTVGLDADKLGRAPKLPAIGAARVPDIKINTSHRPRRDPNKETQQPPAPGSLREPKSATHPPKASMVNFEGLERPVSGEKGESLSDVENALVDVPTNTLDDMPKGMFDDIPTTVFDAIPTAVVERERKRTLVRTSKAAAAAAAAGGGAGTNSRSASAAGSGGQPLVAPATAASGAASPSAAADIFMSARMESEVMSSSSAGQQIDVGAVSLITALFPNAGATVATAAAASRSSEERDQVDSDFVFAVFIQEQEQAAAAGTTVLHVNP